MPAYIAYPQGRPAVLIGLSPDEFFQWRQSFGWNPTSRPLTDANFAQSLPANMTSFSLFVGSDFHDTNDLPDIQSVVQRLDATYFNLASTYIRVHADVWARAPHLSNIFLASSLPQRRRFQLHVVKPPLEFEIVVDSSGGRITTGACIPLDCLDDSVMTALMDLPRITTLAVASPSTMPLLSEARAIGCRALRRQHTLCRLRALQNISLPLELMYDLSRILHDVSALPHCHEINFVVSQSLIWTAHVHNLIVTALRQGLGGFNHLRRVNLPARLRTDPQLQGVLQSIEDLE